MKRSWLNKFLPTVAVIATMCCGCSDDVCYDNTSALALLRFYTSGTTTQVSPVATSIGGIGVPGDTLLLDSVTAGDVYLPLRPNVTTSQFKIRLCRIADNDTTFVTDTLTVGYTPLPYFVSHECGAMYHFRLNDVDVTRHLIDSVAIAAAVVTNVPQVSLRIYIPTD